MSDLIAMSLFRVGVVTFNSLTMATGHTRKTMGFRVEDLGHELSVDLVMEFNHMGN